MAEGKALFSQGISRGSLASPVAGESENHISILYFYLASRRIIFQLSNSFNYVTISVCIIVGSYALNTTPLSHFNPAWAATSPLGTSQTHTQNLWVDSST